MRPSLSVFIAALLFAAPTLAEDRWMTIPAPAPMPAATSTGIAPVNGIQMYYATYGSGDPVLLIHGGLGHADIWSAQVIDLMRDHMVIVADSRGHGRSSRTAEPFGYDLMSSDYLALLDFLKIDKVDLVGWSDGGIIGLDIAMSHPERLDLLFAQAANITTDGVNPAVATDPVFGAYITSMATDYARMSPTPTEFDGFVAQISEMWATQPNWTDAQVAAISVPTTVVAGEYDEAILPAHTQKIAGLIPGATLLIMPGVSHFAMLQAPDEYNAAIRALID